MVGAAERALGSRRRTIVEELRLLADRPRPPYATTSAFRFAYDSSAPRHLADSSAVAQELGVLIRAVSEQPLVVPPTIGSKGQNYTATGDDQGNQLTALNLTATADEATAGSVAEVGAVALRTGARRTEMFLGVPAGVAAREKADQACHALDHRWFIEAEDLFLNATTLLPTEPFLWFGAGLAASHGDLGRAAGYLEKSARYLLPVDPGGATYVALFAAALREQGDDMRGARRVLQQHLEAMNGLCPSLSLHLARLGPDRHRCIAEALIVDPMLEADVLALGFSLGDAIKQRRQRTERELSLLDFSIAELRRVDGGPSWPDDTESEDPFGDRLDLSLTRLEVSLWRKIGTCQSAIGIAERAVQDRERARRVKEDEVATTARKAEADLVHLTAVPFFMSAVAIAVAIVASFVVGRYMGGRYPAIAVPISVVSWLFQLVLVGLAIYQFVEAWWPHRSYQRARQAKIMLPRLEWEAAQLRQSEFDVRRRFNRASQDAELRIRRVVDRRNFLIPDRPTFT